MYRLLMLILLLVACGTKHKPQPQTSPIDEILYRLNYYCSMFNNYVSPLDGDSLYFTGYTRTACNKLNMEDYESEPGRYNRWPVNTEKTWEGNARSENSRDGYLAAMWNAWAAGNRSKLEDIRDWGKSRNWFMGEGRYNGIDTYFIPSFRSTLADMIYSLGGEDDTINRNLPVIWGDCEDYTCWLLVSHILLRGEANGEITGSDLEALKQAKDYYPENPLYNWAYYKYTDGNVSEAINLLLNSPWHFAGRLATDEDYCEEWPFRRHAGNDFSPCPGKKGSHSSGDWAFAAWMLRRG